MTAAALLVYPDFFKVGVSSSGNHENNIYNRWWSEKHHGVKEVTDKEGNVKFEYSIDKNSDIAKNLIGIFLNTRAAGRLPRIEKIAPQKVKTVAMLGGGVMGSGIVNLLLRYGFDAILWDINDGAVQKGLDAIRKTFAYPIKKGKMTQTELDKLIQDHLKTTTYLEGLKGVDLVIEAVLEEMKIK